MIVGTECGGEVESFMLEDMVVDSSTVGWMIVDFSITRVSTLGEIVWSVEREDNVS